MEKSFQNEREFIFMFIKNCHERITILRGNFLLSCLS